MKKLPELKTRKVPKAQRQRLARWLREWELDRALRETPDVRQPVRPGDAALRPGGFAQNVTPLSKEPPVAAGQVRLVSPGLRAGWRRPLYVAILEGNQKRGFLTAPYGRFSEPALPGELRTRRRAPCLRVLCLWNAVTVPERIIRQSWVVDRLAVREGDEALSLYRSIAAGGPAPPGLERRVGPMLIHPDDSRRDYLREEQGVMSELAAGHAASDGGAAGLTWRGMQDEPHELPMAAEPHEPYGGSRGDKKTP